MLQEKKLLTLVEGPEMSIRVCPVQTGETATPEEQTKITKWEEANGQAWTIIELSIGDKEMIHISGASTAKEMWDQLKLVKEACGWIGILAAQRKLYRSYANEGSNIAEHIMEF